MTAISPCGARESVAAVGASRTSSSMPLSLALRSPPRPWPLDQRHHIVAADDLRRRRPPRPPAHAAGPGRQERGMAGARDGRATPGRRQEALRMRRRFAMSWAMRWAVCHLTAACFRRNARLHSALGQRRAMPGEPRRIRAQRNATASWSGCALRQRLYRTSRLMSVSRSPCPASTGCSARIAASSASSPRLHWPTASSTCCATTCWACSASASYICA